VRAFLFGCVVLPVLVGCAGVRSEAPEEQQGQTEATKEQGRSSEATAEAEECAGTRTVDMLKKGGVDKVFDSPVQPGDPEALYTTNDVPGCPNGGLLSGTDKPDRLWGLDGEDEVRGQLAADELSGDAGGDVLYGGRDADMLFGGVGDDVLHGGAGSDSVMHGGNGEDVVYGGDGDDLLWGTIDGGDRDELYCGEGKDIYDADKNDYVDSSCEKKN
jgi:Ca2+-binding RTX toxin-like protein